MGSQFKPGIFNEGVRSLVDSWASGHTRHGLTSMPSSIDTNRIKKLEREPYHGIHVEDQERMVDQRTISAVELSPSCQNNETSSL